MGSGTRLPPDKDTPGDKKSQDKSTEQTNENKAS